ncbi:methyltransferase domain-containing protein [Fontivita pretiosa]|uniref:methyltransferase domain-containing protein n=1 Tax=Fontivita pretiosa TaxID=2989684 RepID=UPI003D179CB5
MSWIQQTGQAGGVINLRALGDWHNPASLANRLRNRRFALLEAVLRPLPRPVRIIDIGGTVAYWEMRGSAGRDEYQITLVNLTAASSNYGNIRCQVGDGTCLREYADKSFDVAFSNSVIEHVGEYDAQQRMAQEVQRVARGYWVQTPNFWFPLEPHFLFPGWQWLPHAARVALIQRRAFGWNGRCSDRAMANRVVSNANLLSRRDLCRLFPDALLVPERFCGLVKSWIAIGGTLADNLNALRQRQELARA